MSKIQVHSGVVTERELRERVKEKRWRLDNLYWIKDKEGNEIPFHLNWAQRELDDNLWYMNVILKARQLGITTFFCIAYLDDVIFNGLDAGFIAHKLDAAKKIFESKVRYAWDRLPDVIRRQLEVDTESARELKFSRNGRQSSIYVGTSLRSGTLQRLHISELGTICQKYPLKADEIMTGALNTVEKGQIITVESTAKGESGEFYDLCVAAMDVQKRGGVKNPMDWKFFFFPWHRHPQYSLEGDVVIGTEMQNYFSKLEAEYGISLTKQQKNWYVKKKETQQERMMREYPSTPEEAFHVAVEGAYYSKQMSRVLEEGRITKVPWVSHLPVDTWWDLGTASTRKDACSIIFTQDIGLEIHIIDFYSNSGEGLLHYAKELDKKPYKYGHHWAPHDIEVKEIGTGKTRLEIASQLGLHFDVLPKMGFLDGIEAARMVFSKCWFDEEKTQELVRALRNYRKEWDENRARFKDSPYKDWASDPADAFRMMAIGHQDHLKLGRYDAEEMELMRMKEREQMDALRYDPFNPFKM